MGTTNHPTPVILDDAALNEIEDFFGRYDDPARGYASSLCATVRALRAELKQSREDAQELSDTIEACHKMFDQIEPDYDEEMTSLTPLETRVREHLFPSDVITDDMVNGDD